MQVSYDHDASLVRYLIITAVRTGQPTGQRTRTDLDTRLAIAVSSMEGDPEPGASRCGAAAQGCAAGADTEVEPFLSWKVGLLPRQLP